MNSAEVALSMIHSKAQNNPEEALKMLRAQPRLLPQTQAIVLTAVAEAFSNKREWARAIQAAGEIKIDRIKTTVLAEISTVVLHDPNAEKEFILRCAEQIQKGEEKDTFISSLYPALIGARVCHVALRLLAHHSGKDMNAQERMLETSTLQLTDSATPELAIPFANTINSHDRSNYYFFEIISKLAEEAEPRLDMIAYAISLMKPDLVGRTPWRTVCLQKLTKLYIKQEKFADALSTLILIQDSSVRSEMIELFVLHAVKAGKTTLAFEAYNLVPSHSLQSKKLGIKLVDVITKNLPVEEFPEYEHIERSPSLAPATFPRDKIQENIWRSILSLIEKEEIVDAERKTRQMPPSIWQDDLLDRISAYCAKMSYWKSAIDAAKAMSPSSWKDAALVRIATALLALPNPNHAKQKSLMDDVFDCLTTVSAGPLKNEAIAQLHPDFLRLVSPYTASLTIEMITLDQTGLKDELYLNTVRWAIEKKCMIQALGAAERIQDEDTREQSYYNICKMVEDTPAAIEDLKAILPLMKPDREKKAPWKSYSELLLVNVLVERHLRSDAIAVANEITHERTKKRALARIESGPQKKFPSSLLPDSDDEERTPLLERTLRAGVRLREKKNVSRVAK